MINSEFVSVLRVFSKAEKKDFLNFLSSPYLKKGKQVEAIFRMCSYVFKQIGKKKEAELLSEKVVYTQVYPALNTETGHDLSNLRNLAKNTIQEFFAYEQFKKNLDKKKREMHFARVQSEKSERTLGQKAYAGLKKWRAGKKGSLDTSGFFTALHSAMDESYFLSTQNKHKDDIGLLALLEELEHFYLHFKTHYTTLLLGQNRNSRLPNAVYQKYTNLHIDTASFYYMSEHGRMKLAAYKLLHPDTATKENFLTLKTAIQEHQQKLPYAELGNYRAILLHFIAAHKDLFDSYPIRAIFAIQKEEFESDFPYKPQKISQSKFYSCCNHAILLGELDWTKHFFEEYKDKILDTESKGETLAYCTALLAFAEKNYEEVVKKLMETTFTDSRLKYLFRVLEIKALYEMDDEVLDTKIVAAVRYFRRENFTNKQVKNSLVNFGNVMSRMIKMDFGYKQQFTQKVLDDIKAYDFIAEREWLVKVVKRAIKK